MQKGAGAAGAGYAKSWRGLLGVRFAKWWGWWGAGLRHGMGVGSLATARQARVVAVAVRGDEHSGSGAWWWRTAAGEMVGAVAGVEVGLAAGGGGFWYSLDVCRSAEGASMAGGRTTGYRRPVRGAEIGARSARFVFGIITGEEARAVPASGLCVQDVFADEGPAQAGQQVCGTVAIPEACIERRAIGFFGAWVGRPSGCSCICAMISRIRTSTAAATISPNARLSAETL
jgi:hypothetical protein